MCNNIEECIERKSLYKEGTFIYEGYTHAYQSLDNLYYFNVKSKGEESSNGKCGKHCLYCNKENSCLLCVNSEYAMASRSIDPKNKTSLYCDSYDKFPEDKFVNFNDIFYPIQNINNAARESLYNQINSLEDEDEDEEALKDNNNKKNNDISEGEVLNTSNSIFISINFLKLSFIIISLVML